MRDCAQFRIRARGRRNAPSETYEFRSEETVGAFLRRCREMRHETLNHVSQALRIRMPYLKAIEEDDWRALPNSVYARAFLRSYAIHVEADPDQVLIRAEAGLDSRPGPDTPLPPLPARDRSLPGGALIGASVLLAIAVYAGWYYFSVEQLRDQRVVAAMPERLVMELAPSERVLNMPAAVSPAVDGSAGPTERRSAAGETGPAASDPVETDDEVAEQVSPGLPAVAATRPEEPSLRARADNAASAAEGIVFHAVEPAYIEVRSVETNEVLVERLLSAGERYRAPEGRGLVLSVGNAGGLEITVDGIQIPKLGESGAVVRQVPIDAELLLRGRTGG